MGRQFKDDISIVIGGEAGQGIQTVEKLLTGMFKAAGYNVFASKEYMSRVRGGSNSTQIRVTSEKAQAFVNKIDLLIPLDNDAIPHLENRITKETVIIGEKEKLKSSFPIVDVPITKMAQDAGAPIYSNTIAVAIVLGIFGLDPAVIKGYLSKYFQKKSKEVIESNIKAAEIGYEKGKNLAFELNINIEISADKNVSGQLLLSGTDAVSLGYIAGGCNFISSYPMTPGSGVLTYLSQHASEFGIIAEQAEDEISAINMAAGAWYAGSRAMVTTSGGGFALMCEGVSLAGMIESPMVINIGQRPGPATGLPTRTEQGDLNLALYSGHGEFPRIIFAPSTIEEAYYIARKTFDLADRFQIPVFILMDQYLTDAYGNVVPFEIPASNGANFIVKTDKSYKRYALTENGISPRGIPGYGEGTVCVDSDEHDESGRITESETVRVSMVNKRFKKYELINKEVLEPRFEGPSKYKTLIVSWGSTYRAIKEALKLTGNKDIAQLHFSQVYPLHASTGEYLKKAKNIIIVENNATGQFADLIRLKTGIEAHKRILKYSGMPFSVEELIKQFTS